MKQCEAGRDGGLPGPEALAEGTGAMDAWAERLASGLERAVGRALEGTGEAAVAFSGGIDSSLIAMLAARRGVALRLYAVGLPGARDLSASANAARELGLDGRLALLEPSGGEVRLAAGRISALFPGVTQFEVSYLAPVFIVCGSAPERLVLTGDGADELFGGYHRYLSMGPARLADSLEQDAKRLVDSGFARNLGLAKSSGKRLSAPYLDPEVVGLSRRIPVDLKVRRGERKAVLRRAAALLGLPPRICALPKRAAQYGSGIHALLKKGAMLPDKGT